MSEQVDHDHDYEDDDGYEANCMTCLGDGTEECMDSCMCFEPDCNGDYHTCPNCRGSGSASDQWYW